MTEKPPEDNNDVKLLETEAGMFLMEYRDRVIPSTSELIDISTVDVEVQNKCKAIIASGLEYIKKNRDSRADPYDFARSVVFELLNYLGEKDTEKYELYKALRDVIISARDSAKGWRKHS